MHDLFRSILSRLLLIGLSILACHSTAVADDGVLRVRVVDADLGHPLPARLTLSSESGKFYTFASDDNAGSAVIYDKQNWINKNSIERHTTVSAHAASARVPKGTYALSVELGKSYLPATHSVVVAAEDVELQVALQRWSNPAAQGWYSGDTHLHRTIDELRNVILAEDLNVALPLTSWVTFSDKPPASGDKTIDDAKHSQLVVVDNQHVIWPRNTEYEIFTVGGKQHTLGALFVLGHRESLTLGVPPWKPVIDSVSAADPLAMFDMDKLDWPFAMLLPTIAPHALYELSNNHTWQTQFAFRDWSTASPAYIQPPFGARSGGHRAWLDTTHGMYYTLLNCGLRLPPTAGTANGVHPVPAGFGRVYVHLPEGFSYEAWMRGLKSGRSFVTTGPMLLATADGRDPGHAWQRKAADKTPIELSVEVTSVHPLLYGEVIINGVPEQLLPAQNERVEHGVVRTRVTHSIVPKRSGWFAVRFWEKQPDGQVRFCHSAPWYVEVDGQPVTPMHQEKEYLINRMREEIARSNGVVSAEAMAEYREGLAFYERLPVADDLNQVEQTARKSVDDDQLNAWLDNMIVDHRYTADEVRWATGLTRERAAEQVRLRTPASDAQEIQGFRLRPYPGGRHPRRGFLNGAVDPQRDTKVSVFPPWKDGGYVVIDVPEAIFSNLGLTYLAHTHVPTIWEARSQKLLPVEWHTDETSLEMRRALPNGIAFTSRVTPRDDGVDMTIGLTNGTDQPLSALRVQVCTMLKGAIGFNLQEPLESIVEGPVIAIRGVGSDRWIVTHWTPSHRVWQNPPVPCIHSDPIFPDCAPGQTVTVAGRLSFYTGPDVRSTFP